MIKRYRKSIVYKSRIVKTETGATIKLFISRNSGEIIAWKHLPDGVVQEKNQGIIKRVHTLGSHSAKRAGLYTNAKYMITTNNNGDEELVVRVVSPSRETLKELMFKPKSASTVVGHKRNPPPKKPRPTTDNGKKKGEGRN